jgi:heme exporter protein A
MSLQARNVGCTRGDAELFAGLSFGLAAGGALRVAGSNGSGKSSLLRILCGLAQPAAGELCWNGSDIRRMREEYRAHLLYLGHASGVKDELLAWENLAMSARLAGQRLDCDAACDLLALLGLERSAELPTRALSQGQRKRVALARLWLQPARPLWILDEPFTALDADAVAQLCSRIDAHLAEGGMLIYTTHHAVSLQAKSHRCVDLDADGATPC